MTNVIKNKETALLTSFEVTPMSVANPISKVVISFLFLFLSR